MESLISNAAADAPPQDDEKAIIRGSEEQAESSVAPTLSAEQETKLWRKIDVQLIPIIATMYFLSFMDRGNIGNAKIEGLMTQLDLTGDKYNIALTMYFIPYCFFEIPSNLIIHVVRPSRWLPGIMFAWGLVMTLMGFVKTYPQLVGLRVCLGVAEAGLFPGVAYYLTMWYPKYMYQYRVALFSAASTMAGAASGFLSFPLGHMGGVGGLEAWSWIFILSGIVTTLAALTIAVFMADYPSTAKFLTEEQRSFVIQKRRRDTVQDQDDGQHAARQIWEAFTDWQVWASCFVLISLTSPVYGITYFLPHALSRSLLTSNSFGYSPTNTQLLTIPPYVVVSIVTLVFAHYSDKIKLRWPFIFAAQSISLTGYLINISNASSGVKYFGLYLCLIGSSGGSGAVTWLANNLGGKYKRATGMAVQITVGNMGGAFASNIYRSQDAPRYLLGHGLEIMFIGIGLVAVQITVLVYKRINSQRDHEELVRREKGQDVDDVGRGDRALSFRYTL
ncbi:MFS general substrate transporter [Paxillus ammoniavirescens]|nr:MFS general substrate transporter [Paxillus ammoniavirescens]